MSVLIPPRDLGQHGPAAGPTPAPSAGSGWFRAFLLRLHFYAGILAAPFLLVAAVSGGLYAMTPQLEKALYPTELHVPAVTQPLSLAEQVSAAVVAAEGATPVKVRPAPGPEDTTRVLFADPTLGESQLRTVFVNPETAEIRGDLPTYGSSGSLPLRTWISTLHRSLHLGEAGRIYSELAASWLWVVALGGFALWIDRLLRRRGPRAQATGLGSGTSATGSPANNPAPGAGVSATGTKGKQRTGRARMAWLHGTLGTVLLVGFMFLSATGLSWSAQAGGNIGTLRSVMGWETPVVSTSLSGAAAQSGAHAGHGGSTAAAVEATATPAEFDTVLGAARASIISSPMVDIRPPASAGKAWTFTEVGRQWPATASVVAVDGTTGEITSTADFSEFGLMAKLTNWTIAAHMGILFGLANQLVLLGVAAGLAVMVVLGYMMWWKRRPIRGSSWALGRPAPRGAFRRGSWLGILAVITVMVGLGFALPLLGWSLLIFLGIDLAIGFVKSRRRRASSIAV
ncbi:PepSY domain-containing protein [Pseudarthrobacter sp. PS3-L1]|uniref:PepSY-associated TM helix domain-containing protein n=1 Tax=Pseudarthrobacter sp. PS3-L1 TaxID=3046207 RepID=UPI0024B98BC7|nr:PepSY domain-containing protein [Pseudarthrobacter sp. PS3-L1]MDJ0320808.1 PepSY domain-containing protein [Pseudarthrobacter sp. PS3-L1]